MAGGKSMNGSGLRNRRGGNRRILLLPLLLVIAVLLGGCDAEEGKLKPTERFFVNDFADVIDSADEDQMYAQGVQLQENTGAQVVVVTVKSLDGKEIRDFGLELGRDWGIGQKEKNSGVLLLMALNERDISIEVGYGLEGGLTDIETKVILDTYAIPYLKKNDFNTGLKKAYNALINEVYIEYGMEPAKGYTPAGQIAGREEETEIGGLAGLVVPFIIILVLVIVFASRRRGFAPYIFSGRGGRFGGGGFGGFGGGGGGGFSGGGGSFGGGGSSGKF